MVKRANKNVLNEKTQSYTKKAKTDSLEENMFIGAHVSIKGGLSEAFTQAAAIGAKSFALFLRNQRRWDFKPLTDEVVDKFKAVSERSSVGLQYIVPHGSYLLNCGSPNEEILNKSRQLLIQELSSCERLGIQLYNIHPGSTCGKATVKETISTIASSINLALLQTNNVTVLIENMSCQGNTVGGKFEEIRAIIDEVDDKSRVGVCLDTCHAFAAGYDIASSKGYETMMKSFDDVIGLQRLRAVHLNDSKSDCGSHLDRHEDIGRGKIGLDLFRTMMNDERLRHIPIILETPGDDTYDKQIATLYDLIQ